MRYRPRDVHDSPDTTRREKIRRELSSTFYLRWEWLYGWKLKYRAKKSGHYHV